MSTLLPVVSLQPIVEHCRKMVHTGAVLHVPLVPHVITFDPSIW
jgi:hypothetical protein